VLAPLFEASSAIIGAILIASTRAYGECSVERASSAPASLPQFSPPRHGGEAVEKLRQALRSGMPRIRRASPHALRLDGQ